MTDTNTSIETNANTEEATMHSAEVETNANTVPVLSDIPMPGNASRAKYPWATMSIGQSFFVPAGKLTTFATTCNKAGHKHNRAFIARKFKLEGEDGVMVWRKA